MTTEDRTKYVNRVHNVLLKTVESGCTAGEAETALNMARKLMDRYGVTMADVEALKADSEGAAEATYSRAKTEGFSRSKGLNGFEQSLGCHVARLTDTRALIGWRGQVSILSFVGDELDVAIAVATYGTLLKLGRSLANAYCAERGRRDYPIFRTFMDGFVQGIGDKVYAIKAESEAQFTGQDADTFALVKLSKQAWLANVLEEMGVVTRKARTATGRNVSGAHQAGRSEGQKASLSVRDKLSA